MKNERPRPGAGGAVDDPRQDHHTASPAPFQAECSPEAAELAALIVILTRLAIAFERQSDRPRIEPMTLRIEEVADALGVSRRAIERERASGRFPRPDLTIGKMPLWRPETVRDYLSQQAPGRRSKP